MNTVIGTHAATVGTPETSLTDLFAMPVEALIVTTASPLGVTVSLKIKGANMVKVHGRIGEDWRTVLGMAMELAAEDRRAHVCEHGASDPDNPSDPCMQRAVSL